LASLHGAIAQADDPVFAALAAYECALSLERRNMIAGPETAYKAKRGDAQRMAKPP